jgi:hypothetical protein
MGEARDGSNRLSGFQYPRPLAAAGRPSPNQTNRDAQEVNVPKLVIFRGDAVENEVRLTGNTVRIGRHTRNDVVLDDRLNGVSRFHAEIRREGGVYFIVDVNSRNGVWINGRKIKEKAELALGVPATVGAFELALEDDVSTSDFNESGGHTIVSGASTARRDGPERSAIRPKQTAAPSKTPNRQAVLWSAAAAIVLLICAVTFAIVRYRTRPAVEIRPVEAPPVAVVQPPPELPPAEPPVDPNKALNDQDLADARAQIAAKEYAAALRDHLQPLLERDPENADALELKRQVDQAMVAPKKAPPKTEAPAEAETPGIPRRPNEPYADYQARAKRIQTALSDGKASLEKQEYAAAITHFRAVEREQPKYQGVDLLVAEAARQQQKALDEAIGNGQLGEQASKLGLARQWYQRAVEIDPGSTSAREKHASVLGRLNTEANKLFNQASFAQKSGDASGAIQKFQQVVDLMLPGDEIRARATKELEALKR